MDILIKGVKMPKKGQYLQILIAENGEMSYEHVYYNSPSAGFKLHKSKAVALPSHGRLIDVDEFKASIHMNHLDKFATNRDVQVLYKLLNNAPTIVEANNE